MMDPSRLELLSERQRECLRLFHASYEAKEIAFKLGLSPHTVNQHLRDARTIVGASRSIEAARMLVAHEGNKRIMVDPIGIDRKPVGSENASATAPDTPVTVVRNRYNLDVLQRIGLIIAIAFIVVALAGALLVGAEAITRIFRDNQIDISDPPYR